MDCPRLQVARNGIFARANPNLRFDDHHIAEVITFLRRTWLGFSSDVCDKILKDDLEADDLPVEADDLDVGPIGDLSLDLDF